MNDRDSIKATIRKLRERTVARGCSEPEARAALDKAAELMRAHGLDEVDLEMAEVSCDRPATVKPNVRDRLAAAVAACTNTAAMKTSRWGGASYSFSGPTQLAEIAAYTRDMLEAAVDREVRAFKRTTGYKRKRTLRAKTRATQAFTAGMVGVLAQRLLEAFEGQQNDELALRSQQWRDRRHPDAGQVGRPRVAKDSRAASWGVAAGLGVELSAGVAADGRDGELDGPRRLIGKV